MRSKQEIAIAVNQLLNQMTLVEKIGQFYQTTYDGSAITGPEFDSSKCINLIKQGKVGSIIGQYDNKKIYYLQKCAVEESRLKIPLLFANDIIHGCRIAFPVNIGMSCSWNPNLVQKVAEAVSYECSHSGVHLTYSPMLDIVNDPRWGRVVESNGEDPYLGAVLATSYVKGYQGKLDNENNIGCCAKHFVGYGACVGGREYDAVEMSENTLFNKYLPPFKAAVKAGVLMVMSSFNTFNGIPVTMNKHLLKEVLRKKLKFKGVIISDYTSTTECINHKTALDESDAGKKAMQASVDMEIIGTTYINNLEMLVNENKISIDLINEACKRVLTLKYRLGLFDNPYKNIYFDFEKYWLKEENLKVALQMANESICLLKNNQILPFNKNEKIAFMGPFVDEQQVIGPWGGKAQAKDTITLLDALKKGNYQYEYFKGCEINKFILNDVTLDLENIKNNYDTICLAVGEQQWMSGECNSRAHLDIPSAQEQLIEKIIALGKRIVLVIFAGRPLVLTKYVDKVDAIVYAWYLGTTSGQSIIDTLYGKNNPSGKITMSFPLDVGQIPVYYNRLPTGRPLKEGKEIFYENSYRDISLKPLYPFGFGLSYSEFQYGKVQLSDQIITKEKAIELTIPITNKANIDGFEVVQLYIEALYGEISRPVKELKAFKKVMIKAHETKQVQFKIGYKDLQYYHNKVITDEGVYRIYVGSSSEINIFNEVIFKKK